MASLLNKVINILGNKKPKPSQSGSSSSQKSFSSSSSVQENAQATATAREIILLAKEEAEKIRKQAQQDIRSLKASLKEFSDKLKKQQLLLKQQEQQLTQKAALLEKEKEEIARTKQQILNIKTQQLEKLEKIAQLSREQAKQLLLDTLRKHLSKEMALLIKTSEEKAKEEADAKAKEILVDAMYHGATDYVAEYTVSTVKLPNEDIKGRIIGKDGRNIRAFEKVTGVDLDMDETPGEIRLSCFNPIRREIARLALERLIKDGRIQPSRIEEYVAKAKRDIDKVIFEEGKKLAHAVGAYQLPRELLSLLGRFKYRTSYGQNMIAHTLEETKIGMKLAAEIGANVDTVRLGCLFHDIGKVIDEEGSHVELGVKVLKKFNLPQPVIDTVAQHHEDEEFTSIESIIVYIADAISGSRPGARYENYEEYVKRLNTLEEIAKSHSGVQEAYAIQAGRELRVIVKPDEIDDAQMVLLAQKIRDEIQEKVTYPGTVTVNVIRETRASALAK